MQDESISKNCEGRKCFVAPSAISRSLAESFPGDFSEKPTKKKSQQSLTLLFLDYAGFCRGRPQRLRDKT